MRDGQAIEQFAAAMAEHGIMVSESDIIPDGKIHRIYVEGDRKGSKNAWFILYADDRPAGAFGCNKRLGSEVRIKWTAKGMEPLTPEQRREFAIKMAEQKAARAIEEQARFDDAALRAVQAWEAAAPATDDHPYLVRKGVVAHGLRVGRWEVASRSTGEISVVSENALLIPLRDKSKAIRSLQAIFPDADNFMQRDKTYLSGGQKSGMTFSIGKPTTGVIQIGEGYATCATAYQANGHAVIVAFDASNLVAVAMRIRKAFPSMTIVILADNDRWSKTGEITNPGLYYAKQAAAASGAVVALPAFADDSAKPTDFNDLAALEGIDQVRIQIDAAINPPAPVVPHEPPPKAEPSPAPATEAVKPKPAKEDPLSVAAIDPNSYYGPDPHPHFKMLGYDHEKYFFFQLEKQQLACYSKGDFTEPGLIALAPLKFWEQEFPGAKGGIDKKMAMNWLMRACYRERIYDDQRLRGRGAWIDKDRVVYHHGGHLSVDGKRMPITDLKSRYVYELQKSLPDPAPEGLSDEDGSKLVYMAEQFKWTKPGSAALLAGWVALAPLCGALRWRPHVWITGGPGSGKTTVLERFVFPLMNGHEIYAQGNSSEAGVRQTLRSDALPVLFDESESNTERDESRMQGVLSLVRQASSESNAKTLKGSAGGEALSFHIRSMFCLASIQVGIKHQADVERLTVLSMRPKRDDGDAAGTWEFLDEELYKMARDLDLPARLMTRSLELLPITRKNIDTFAKAAAQKFGTQREGDQYGTLLAGCWSLLSREIATPEQALALIDTYDWSEHMEGSEHDDSSLAFTSLMDSHIRLQGGIEVTVFELAMLAMGNSVTGADMLPSTADAVLQRYGMRVKADRLLLSNKSPQLAKLMHGTPYSANLRAVLLRMEGANRFENRAVRFNGSETKCISVLLPSQDDLPPSVTYGAHRTPRAHEEPF